MGLPMKDNPCDGLAATAAAAAANAATIHRPPPPPSSFRINREPRSVGRSVGRSVCEMASEELNRGDRPTFEQSFPPSFFLPLDRPRPRQFRLLTAGHRAREQHELRHT